MVDKAQFPREKCCGDGLTTGALRELEVLGLDPFAVRRANLLTAPTRTLNDLMVNSYGLGECLDKVERESGWRERIGKLPPGKGLGMACSH